MLCPQCQSNRVNVKAVNAIEGGIIKIRGICNNCGHVGELIKSPPLSKGDSGGLK